MSPSHTVFLPSNNQQSPFKATKQQQDPSTKTYNSLPSLPSFNYPTHNKSSPHPKPNPQTTNNTHTHAMASPMYRPSFSRSLSSAGASISSKSSSTSSTRAVYTRDGQGFDFSESYPSTGISAEAVALVAQPAFTRAEYSRDARGQNIDFAGSYKFSKQQAATSRAPFKGCAYAKDGKGFNFAATYKGSN
jgi:hypothetical protein